MARAIVGVEIQVTRLEGKWKMGRNKFANDAQGVVNGLLAQGGDAMAALVSEANPLDG